jgi:hypothetical protein
MWKNIIFQKDHSFIYSVQAFFNAPDGDEPLALDMSSMGKGQIWINGQGIGRYWPGYKASGTCGICDYRGEYDEKKCQTNCGDSSQRWYTHFMGYCSNIHEKFTIEALTFTS